MGRSKLMMTEAEFNRRHKKALKDAEPSGKKKRKKRVKKEKVDWFKGLGASSRKHFKIGGTD